jgi:hypothetical protein
MIWNGKSSLLAGLMLAATLPSSADTVKPPGRKPLADRLSEDHLTQFDQDREKLVSRLKTIEVPYPFKRSILHAHSYLSHDSNAQIPEIIAAAKATNTMIVGFTNHRDKDVDVVEACVKGWHEGVYFLAGTETNELFWPGREGQPDLRFVSHPEGVPSFDRTKYQGMEIYNTHSDAIDEPMSKLFTVLITRIPSLIKHPNAAFCALIDYPKSFLERFDRLTMEAPFAGIGAVDAHQNQRVKLVAHPDGSVEALDFENESIWKGTGVPAALLMSTLGQKGPPDEPKELVDIQIDPYELSTRHVGTYLQIDDVNEKTVRHAIGTGRIILALENVVPLPQIGFWVERDGQPIGTVGDQIQIVDALTIRCVLPLPGRLRLIQDGQPVLETTSDGFSLSNVRPGVYRLEAFLTLAGESWPWVISNPIYIRGK